MILVRKLAMIAAIGCLVGILGYVGLRVAVGNDQVHSPIPTSESGVKVIQITPTPA